jgi:hypothetical protein
MDIFSYLYIIPIDKYMIMINHEMIIVDLDLIKLIDIKDHRQIRSNIMDFLQIGSDNNDIDLNPIESE